MPGEEHCKYHLWRIKLSKAIAANNLLLDKLYLMDNEESENNAGGENLVSSKEVILNKLKRHNYPLKIFLLQKEIKNLALAHEKEENCASQFTIK